MAGAKAGAETASGDSGRIVAALLAWYAQHRRDLPWRAPPGARADPYRVWLSEIMLQQTTVAAVIPYFHRFLDRWPDLGAFAAAPREEVLKEWAGLGYYARARNLHACAGALVARHGGEIPRQESQLRALPGIGPYTAAAIAAIAFDAQAVPVDGNIERVLARLFALQAPLPAAKREIAALARAFLPLSRPGDFAQGLMDLGAAVCTPKSPDCARCPLARHCRARELSIAGDLPRRAPRKARPTRHACAFWLECGGSVLLRQREDQGLLGAMMEVPTGAWVEDGGFADHPREAPLKAPWRRVEGLVRHTFTHFHLEIRLWRADLPPGARPGPPMRCRWVPVEELAGEALPSVMRKLAALAARSG